MSLFRLALLVPVLFLGACINNDNQAFEVPPNLLGSDAVLIDSVQVNLETFQIPKIQTNGYSQVVAGTYIDGTLGTFQSEAFFQFLPESYPLVYPESPIAEDYLKGSITLQTDLNYGRFGQNEWGLFPLTAALDGDRSFFSNEPPPPATTEPLISTPGASRENTLIRMDANALARDFFTKWKSVGRINNDREFLNLYHGFALKSLQTIPQVARFKLNYGSQEAPAFFEIQYRLESDPNTVNRIRFLVPPRAVHGFRVFPDYTGTRWVNLSPTAGLPATSDQPEAGIQDLSGLAVKLKLPGLKTLLPKLGPDLKLFRAQLIVTPQSPGSLTPPEEIRISTHSDYQIPTENEREKIVFNEQIILQAIRGGLTRDSARSLGATRFFGYTENQNQYVCDITGHIRNFLNGQIQTTDLNLYSQTLDPKRIVLKPGSVQLKLIFNRI